MTARGAGRVPAGTGKVLAALIVGLLLAVVGLDQWQAAQGHSSLLGLRLLGSREVRSTRAPARAMPAPRPQAPSPAAGAPGRPAPGGRVAVIVDDLGARRDVFDALRELGRPLTVAVLPELPLSEALAREAIRSGMEVLLDLPMEPYRYPEVDPGPGALTMAMDPVEVGRRAGRHLDALAGVVGVTNHLGSRMTEDRPRMRAVLETVGRRGLFFVDAMSTNHSVAYDEARALGVRAGRRQILVDPATGEGGERGGWEAVGRLATERDVIVLAHGHPLTTRLLREYVPRWEAAGHRLVLVSQLVR